MMRGRRAVLGVLMLAAAGPPAFAQSTPARRRARRQDEPLPLPPPPPPPQAWGDPAPVPNAEIEAPDRPAGPHARVDPVMIDPDAPRTGATTDRHGPQAREDRLLRQPGAGARLRIPFSY